MTSPTDPRIEEERSRGVVGAVAAGAALLGIGALAGRYLLRRATSPAPTSSLGPGIAEQAPTGNLAAVARFARPDLPWERLGEEETRRAVEAALGRTIHDLLAPESEPALNAPSIAALARRAGAMDASSGAEVLRGLEVSWLASPRLFGDGPPLVTDPVQGVLNDCYFIASLSAYAWVDPGAIHWAISVATVDGRVPRAVYADVPLFGRCADPTLGWTALLEKELASAAPSRTAGRPDYLSLDHGGGLTPIGTDPGPVFGSLATDADVAKTLDRLGSGRARDVAFFVSPWMREASTDPRRLGVVPGHAFTYLGRTTIDKTPCVVLRNPWGWCVPPATVARGHGREAFGLRLGERGVFAFPVSRLREAFSDTHLIIRPDA